MKAFAPIHPGGFHVQRMRGGFQPIPYQQIYRKPELGQAIQINPNIQAPINIGLGSLPLSVGLFAGSGMALLIGSQVPSIRTLTTIASLGLAGLGVFNLLMPKGAAAAAPPTTAPVAPGQSSGPIAPTAEDAFKAVEGRILSPAYGDTINVSAFGSANIPMRVRLINKSPEVDASFDLGVGTIEEPSVGATVTNSQTMRVLIPHGETRDVDITIGVSSWGMLERSGLGNIRVDVTVTKRRIDGGDKENLAGVMFMVE
jgi:hypothetical protein